MPDDGSLKIVPAAPAELRSGRPDRAAFVAFLSDADSEATVREGLAEAAAEGLEVRRGGIRQAIVALQKMATPRILLVDVTGEDQPLTALADLSEVVEPDVRVLVVGDRQDVNFYRQLTRGLGVVEYLYKPLSRDMVARHFAPCVQHQAPTTDMMQGGRVVTITGSCGGVGATTLAVNLAWHFAVDAKRHTVLLDPDLHTGTAAMMLGAKTGSGLRTALETPSRVDELFIERSAQPAADRLSVLASEEKLTEQPNFAPGAAQKLLTILRRRYNFVVVDAPFGPSSVYRDLLELAQQRVLVMEPSLAAVRDTLRLLALPNGPQQARRAVVVLNRAGQPGGLSRDQVEDALKMKVDVAVPYLPRQVGMAATLGEAAMTARSAFRTGVLNLAREIAFVRVANADPAKGSGKSAHRLFRWKR